MDLSQFDNEYNLQNLELVTPQQRSFQMWITPRFKTHYQVNLYEEFTSDLIENFVKNIDLFIDVGAHYGYFSLLAGTSNPQCEIVSFEPVPENYAILKKNIEQNHLGNITPMHKAVSNKNSKKKFCVSTASDNCAFIAHPATPTLKNISVETVNLQELLSKKNSSRILIKIDAEGHELKILEGIDDILSGKDNIQLLLEFNPTCICLDGTTPEALLTKIDDLGYEIFFLDDKCHVFYQPADNGINSWRTILRDKTYVNLLCKKKSVSSNLLFFSHSSLLAGAERGLLELVSELTHGHDSMCTVILPSHGPLEKKLQKVGAATLIGSINWWCKFYEQPTTEEIRSNYSQSFEWIHKELQEFSLINPDVVLTNTIVIPWGAITSILLKCPHIWCIREFGELDHGLHFFLPFDQILQIIQDSSDYIVTNSLAVQNTLFPGNNADNIKTIYSFIEMPAQETRNKLLKNNHFLISNALHLIITGSVMESKGQEDAVKAVIELVKYRKQDLELIIAGYAQTNYEKYLEELIKEGEAGDYVHILPFQEDVLSIISEADIVLVCSKMEAFGRVTLEAMLMEKTIIATDTGGTKELIIDGKTGLLYKPGDYIQLVELIEQLLNDPQQRLNLAQNAFKFASQMFTQEKYGGDYHKIINEMKSRGYKTKEKILWFLSYQDELLFQRLTAQVAEREEAVQTLTAQVAEREEAVQTLTAQVAEREEAVQTLTAQVAERDQIIKLREQEILNFVNSKSWKVTRPLRQIKQIFQKPRNLLRLIGDYIKIKKTELFNEQYYLVHNSDVAQAKVDPLIHYLLHGGFEGRDPGPSFSSESYLINYPDVLAANINPLVHYLHYGQQEGRFANIIKTNNESSSTKNQSGLFILLALAWRSFCYPFYCLLAKLKIWKFVSEDVKAIVAFDDPNGLDIDYLRIRAFNVVPFYLNPFYEEDDKNIQNIHKIAVHLHLFCTDSLDQCVKYLINIPFNFDLYISTSKDVHQDALIRILQNQIPFLENVKVKIVKNCSSDLVPLIIDFKKDLLEYDFVAHIHDQKSFDPEVTNERFEEGINTLLGSKSNVYQIYNLLLKGAKFVYPALDEALLRQESGWQNTYNLAKDLINKYLRIKIESYPQIEYPRESMFWARSNALRSFLKIPLKYSDFQKESISIDETMGQVLERLILISAINEPGENFRIKTPKTDLQSKYYECQNNYSDLLAAQKVKVLSYYLPQFYAIPENDEWHGKGFTEWNKVRSANPLFYQHYQQRTPHEDIGFYTLNSPEMLKVQADIMKQSGVHGQVFYHYWFNGKLILEKPSQMLLADKSIDMPFCFCWANENWTRKWDGNEDEVLLSQEYSEQDAIQFINYLLPFFRDDRYIRVNEKPLIFIYRPSSIPDFELYRKCWKSICEANGILTPYIVAVLTRDTKSPIEYRMDAGCERVLHDWTNGNVKEINKSLYKYWPIRGSVLSYNEVADYYVNQPPKTDFIYFRSLVPAWDNTPRYGSDALLIHDSTPEKFQEWLRTLILDAEKRLPMNQQFVIINAWNEWSEGAVLEPDIRFGYAFLNSIGRALSGLRFQDREYLNLKVHENTQISISFTNHLLNILQEDEKTRQKMLFCIANSTVFSLCDVYFEQEQANEWMSSFSSYNAHLVGKKTKSDFTLHICDVCYFPPDTIENMLKMSLCYNVGVISPTHVNDKEFTHEHLNQRWEVNQSSSYMFLTNNKNKRSMKCCVDARIFISKPRSSTGVLNPKVSTIVRFSQSDNLNLLQNALYSLIAQVDCAVQPIIAVKDLSDDKMLDLDVLIKKIPWDKSCFPLIRKYNSEDNKDLRSLMLNDSLKSVTTKYVAFLDYDDVLFPDAYDWLVKCLVKTGKKASFGSIYKLIFNLNDAMIKKRIIDYRFGGDYESFLNNNNTPIHGFMLNTTKIDLMNIEYFEDMQYMEDYYLTLQIFDHNDTDWDSMMEGKYIGDYYYYEDKPQTLAYLNNQYRDQLLINPKYIECEVRINALRKRICSKSKYLPS